MRQNNSYYSAMYTKDSEPIVVYYKDSKISYIGCPALLNEDSFYWISDKPIVLETKPIELIDEEYYLFSVGFNEPIIGFYVEDKYGPGMYVAKSKYHIENCRVILGPIDLTKLVSK